MTLGSLVQASCSASVHGLGLIRQQYGDGVAHLVDDALARVVEHVLTRHVEQLAVIDRVFEQRQ